MPEHYPAQFVALKDVGVEMMGRRRVRQSRVAKRSVGRAVVQAPEAFRAQRRSVNFRQFTLSVLQKIRDCLTDCSRQTTHARPCPA